jgi:hypothetical protein
MSATGMHASRRLDSQVKTQRLRAAVAALIAAGRPTTIAQVAREAGVSRKFIYSHPELRAEIEHRTLQAAAGTGSALVSDARVSAASLRADLENSRALVHRLRGQVAALERRLSESLGRQIAGELHDDEPTGAASVEVRERLERAEQRAFELQEALAGAQEELAAVREINRELLAAHNRPAS